MSKFGLVVSSCNPLRRPVRGSSERLSNDDQEPGGDSLGAAITECSPQPAIIGDLDLGTTLAYDEPATVAYVLGDADDAALKAAMGLPTIDVLTLDGYIDSLSSNLDSIVALVHALLAVAVLIELVGIANTVSLAVSERSGEIAAIRAAGASSHQIFWSLIVIAGLLGGAAASWLPARSAARADILDELRAD